jgi:hypothetical protein
VVRNKPGKENTHVSSARKALLWLAAAAVKAQDELAALGLDSRLASQKSPDIRAKENIRYELTSTTIILDNDRPSHGRPNRPFRAAISGRDDMTMSKRSNVHQEHPLVPPQFLHV